MSRSKNAEGGFVQENTNQGQPTGGQSVLRGANDTPMGVWKRLTFREAIALAEEQVGIREVERYASEWSVLHDMCRVMAEVYMAHPRMQMQIGGEVYDAGLVAEVYREMTPECARELAVRLTEVIGSIKHIKAYLRSAIYNAVFEFESSGMRAIKQEEW